MPALNTIVVMVVVVVINILLILMGVLLGKRSRQGELDDILKELDEQRESAATLGKENESLKKEKKHLTIERNSLNTGLSENFEKLHTREAEVERLGKACEELRNASGKDSLLYEKEKEKNKELIRKVNEYEQKVKEHVHQYENRMKEMEVEIASLQQALQSKTEESQKNKDIARQREKKIAIEHKKQK